MEPSNKNKFIAVAVILIIFGIIFFVFTGSKSGIGLPGVSPGGAPAGGGQGQGGNSTTRTPAPANVSVPGATSTVSADVAKPQVVAPAAPGVSKNFRSFKISVGNNVFSPSTVIVNVGDTVHLNLTAADKNYDFTQPDYGFNLEIPKGQTKLLEFQTTTEGKFTFYCKACGGPASGPVGYIIVASQ